MIEWAVEMNWKFKQGTFMEIVLEPPDEGCSSDLEDETLYKGSLGDQSENWVPQIAPEDFEELYMWFYS
ncbi:MAG: hypothetical protein EHM41_16870 [Chloroflexi bacterium]|nr:MAG: hypothetical protein EHM41_16870 [Chloroflexota bacterium]